MILTRQALPTLDRTKYAAAARVGQGRLRPGRCAGRQARRVLLLATGSEVSLCVDAYEKLKAEGIKARVVSMPSWELFEHHADPEYREQRVAVLRSRPAFPSSRRRRSAGTTTSDSPAHIIGMKTFGASAPLKELQKKFGFTPEAVVAAAKEQVLQAKL